MNGVLEPPRWAELSDVIAARMGLHFPEERWSDLARGIDGACKELGVADAGQCVRDLIARGLTTHQVETIASHLTIGETYFFRDHVSFDALEHTILPRLAEKHADSGRTLRLWSVGCCTGEEAYSMAISCVRALPQPASWNLSILATDINTKFLAKAEAGVYSEWSFRDAPDWLRSRHFSPVGEKQCAIDPSIRRLVHFEYLNLADDVYPSMASRTNAMDVIFCRNVLMYFTPGHQRRVVAALYECLVDGGYLFVSPAEGSAVLFSVFEAQSVDGVLFYRKPGATATAPFAAAHPVAPFVFAVPAEPAVPVAPAGPVAAGKVKTGPGADVLLAQARALANQGLLEESLASCTVAITADRTNPSAHYLLAMICRELGRNDEALVALRSVLYLDQDVILAHHALGALNRELGKRKASQRHLAIALELLLAKGSDDIVPESDGMTCGRLVESVRAMLEN